MIMMIMISNKKKGKNEIKCLSLFLFYFFYYYFSFETLLLHNSGKRQSNVLYWRRPEEAEKRPNQWMTFLYILFVNVSNVVCK